MGCGTAMTSIFLAKEFGVQVWANDLWISATDNFRRNPTSGLSTPWPGGGGIGNKPIWLKLK